MYIQPNYNNINMYGARPAPRGNSGKGRKPGFWKHLKQKVLDAIPECTFKDSNRTYANWEKYDKFLSRPAENRLIMGATAIVTQPTIDYYNHKVDEETRTISRNRTIAKIIVGTLVGIAVRGSSYNLVKRMTNINGKERFSKSLLPSKNFLSELVNNEKSLANYRSALSTGLAILAMCITNFAIDAPLTVILTNHFNEKYNCKKSKEEKGEVKNE